MYQYPRHASTTGGIICTSDPRASQAGVAMLDAGGNYIDAAIVPALDRQIDQLVYRLYGLTDDEIRIVEEATNA